MDRRIVIFLALLLPGRLWSATITAVGNGSWSTNSVWSCNCQPSSSDNIVIPAGRSITISGPVILFLGPVISITIGGTLTLNNGSLQVDASDVISVLSGGKITGTGILGGSVFSGVTPVFVPNGSSIDGPKTISNGVLPIKLLYFKSSVTADGIELQWASAEEKDFDHYDISRSADGMSFDPVAMVPGKSGHGAEYYFTDTAPLSGTNFYKLTAVDLDGSREEMQIIKAEWNGREQWITIYPNPVSDNTIYARIFGGGSGSLRLLDCNGLVVAECFPANDFQPRLQLPAGTPPGAYVVVAEIDGHIARIKLIVQ
jgi:hypothetical protein